MSGRFIFLLLINYSLKTNYVVQSCSCAKFTYKPYLERIKYLVKLVDSTKLESLTLIGTHLSLSYIAKEERFCAQDLNIVQQLKYGIRVFDIRVQLRPELFKIELNYVSVNNDFRELLYEFDKFLDDNPGEFIIMFIHQTRTAVPKFKEKTCEVIDYYIDNIGGGWRMVKDWKLSDPIGMYRNRILLASSDHLFTGCTFNINIGCIMKDTINWRAESKTLDSWKKIRYIHQAVSVKKVCPNKSKCFIHDISYIDDGYDRRVIAKDGGYKIGDYCIKPFNLLMTNNFINPHCKLTIIIADHPTQELIDIVNDSNFKNSSWRSGWE